VNIYKERLPVGWSYALKPSLLEHAITHAEIQLPVSLHQRHKVWETNTPILSAMFYPHGSYMGGENGRFSVTSCAIQSSEREFLQDFAERTFLPAFVAWIMSIEALPQNSTIMREVQYFSCDGSPIALNKRPLALVPKGQTRRKRT
jgi:hypothetical protein